MPTVSIATKLTPLRSPVYYKQSEISGVSCSKQIYKPTDICCDSFVFTAITLRMIDNSIINYGNFDNQLWEYR